MKVVNLSSITDSTWDSVKENREAITINKTKHKKTSEDKSGEKKQVFKRSNSDIGREVSQTISENFIIKLKTCMIESLREKKCEAKWICQYVSLIETKRK